MHLCKKKKNRLMIFFVHIWPRFLRLQRSQGHKFHNKDSSLSFKCFKLKWWQCSSCSVKENVNDALLLSHDGEQWPSAKGYVNYHRWPKTLFTLQTTNCCITRFLSTITNEVTVPSIGWVQAKRVIFFANETIWASWKNPTLFFVY